MINVRSLRLLAIWFVAFFLYPLLPLTSFADTTVGGTISTDTVWALSGSPYVVASNITVKGTDGADGITTLTVEPGVVVKFNQYRYMNIGASSGDPGALVAQGEAGNPILFTSNQATPAPGDWYYIRFYNTTADATTVMEHCTVEYGGYSSGSLYLYQASPALRNVTVQDSNSYGLNISYAEPVIENCIFSSNQNYDLYYTGTVGGSVTGSVINSGISMLADGVVHFSDNTVNQNNSYVIKAKPDMVGAIVSGSSFTNVDADSYLEVSSGTISHDAAWTAAIPYVVLGYLTVVGTDGEDDITTLSIEPGAEISFNSRTSYMLIGNGSGDPGALAALGTAGQPILFTSNTAEPAAADWIGIRIYNTADDATTVLDSCIFENAGYYNNSTVYIVDAAPTLRNCIIRNGAYYDLAFSGTVGGNIENCTIHNGVKLQTDSSVSFSGNTFHHNNAFPIKTYADSVTDLVNDNTFTNVDATSYLEVSSILTKDAVWTSAIPYKISSLKIQGADGPDGITTLEVQPGAVLMIQSYLDVGYGTSSTGALLALGTETDPIKFTSINPTAAPGDWYGIRIFDATSDSTRFEHCLIEYAGYQNNGAIAIQDAAPSIDNCTFSNNLYYDLVYSGSAVGGSVTGCSLNNSLLLQVTSTVDFTGNIFHNNVSFPIKANADNVHSLVNGNTFTDLDAASFLLITEGSVSRDAIWTSTIPLKLNTNLTVKGTHGDDGVTTLNLLPGTIIKFGNRGYINVGDATGAVTGEPGALVAQGSPDEMILFTSGEAAPSPGSWDAVKFFASASDDSILEHCILEYGGYYQQGALLLRESKATVRNSLIRNNLGPGVGLLGTASSGSDIQCNTFENNVYGIRTFSGAAPVLHLNNFTGNTTYAVSSNSPETVIAEENWWGDPAGPNQGGDQIQGNVDADPWSTEPNDCLASSANEPPNQPAGPAPADNAVRVQSSHPITLSWSGGDPDPTDTVVYDLYLGTQIDALVLTAQDLSGASYVISTPTQGITYFWQVTARDSQGVETTGPVWRFTSSGGYPDLLVSLLETTPPGHLQAGQSVILTVTILNAGAGPMVDYFTVEIKIGGASIGTVSFTEIMLAGESVGFSLPFTYDGGDPQIEIRVDSLYLVTESNEANNQYLAQLWEVADMTAPVLSGTVPGNDTYLQEVNSILVTLSDSQSEVNPMAVAAGLSVIDSSQQSVPGSVAESNDTFTFTPASVPMADGVYTVSLTAEDIYGNTHGYSFFFTVDSQPPAKPVITGEIVASGTIQARPAQNTADQFIAELSGTRDADTSIFIDSVLRANIGGSPWSVEIQMQPGSNSFEVWAMDRAGNQSASEWVDIIVSTTNAIYLDYDHSGRVKRIDVTP